MISELPGRKWFLSEDLILEDLESSGLISLIDGCQPLNFPYSFVCYRKSKRVQQMSAELFEWKLKTA